MAKNDACASGSERLDNVRVDYENDQIVIDGVAIELAGREGGSLKIDHAGAQDGYIAFLEPGENGGVKLNGQEATVFLTEPTNQSASTRGE